ncbi:thiamine pyrophosphate-dependent dehydrogenase E1 component subunit alpha [Thalassovita aquimarina]|uniref:Thiamine pyrophosphate-dependent dehydrogenase E1 component subunit alpha n=1 Tax=Thalassovita aquimarina TaxID=2785917 RepID=A0ABS5HRB0_9RHOB|nr:thiamine pyrophosphate-dependent dehydrogenase E1 component subunit alpha [Thalassovita aquimarina]MBR9651516.1 thiamine pyrophosphate-dependent dehydrogenase E1 component subunit alpha [Thalassovita aquimarina]
MTKKRNDKSDTDLLGLYRKMRVIREAETALSGLFANNEIPGFIHLSLGQEAVAAGVCDALRDGDTLASNHRGHGHALAQGVSLDQFFLELFGKDGGICRGRGGSMHIADMSVGMLGANGIVGGGLPIALGSALAHSIKKSDQVAVVFFGDGALGEGAVHEVMNLAALWNLPLLMVCENNGWSEFSRSSDQIRAEIGDLAKAFSIPFERVDGTKVRDVRSMTADLCDRLRTGQGPAILECLTVRWHGHYEGDPQKYRAEGDQETATSTDCVALERDSLIGDGFDAATLDALDAEVKAEVEAVVIAARNGASPSFATALGDVHRNTIGSHHV